MRISSIRALRRALITATVALTAATVLGPAATAAAAPGGDPSTAPQRQATALAASGGGCRATYGVSACISTDSSNRYVPDFYVNSLSGLPAGTRFDAWVTGSLGTFSIVKKGVLDHTGHYGAWPVSMLDYTAQLHVVVSDPSGTVIYYFADSPTASYGTGPRPFVPIYAGHCTPTYQVSACISRDSAGCLVPDFYLNAPSGLPAGSRYDVIVMDEFGRYAWVKKGILDHNGHYGPWPLCFGSAASYSAVVVSDPSGSIIYYSAYTYDV